MFTNKPLLRVFIAILLAILVGYWAGPEKTLGGVTYVHYFDLLGKLFLNALTLVVVPLVTSSIISGVAKVGADHTFAKLGKRTFFFFLLTVVISVAVGFAVIVLVNPGSYFDPSAKEALIANNLSKLTTQPVGDFFINFEKLLLRLVPSNILQVAAEGQMLGLIFFSILFGLFSSRIAAPYSQVMMNFWRAVFDIMMKMTHVVMKVLPVGVFGLMAKVVATTGMEAIIPVAYYFLSVLIALGIFAFIVLPIMLKTIAGVDPRTHFRMVFPALFTAFTTSSSAATLPITLECMERNAGVPNRICSFVLPLGTSLNLTGSSLFNVVSVIFLAQVYGLEMSMANMAIIFLMSCFAGLGMVVGVPSGCIIGVMIILQTVGLPQEGVVLILAVDRFLDMCRTAVTVFGHTCNTVFVAKGFPESPIPHGS